MFLTTVRVRRARATTLDHALSGRAFTDARASKTVVEVLCHGQAVALVELADGRVLWEHPAINGKLNDATFVTLARRSQALMECVKSAGLTAREPETV